MSAQNSGVAVEQGKSVPILSVWIAFCTAFVRRLPPSLHVPEARRTSRSSCCATNSASCTDTTTDLRLPTTTGRYSAPSPKNSPDRAARLARHPRHIAPLAPATHRQTLDSTTPKAWTAINPRRRPPADNRDGHQQPHLGISANPRRTHPPRLHRWSAHRRENPALRVSAGCDRGEWVPVRSPRMEDGPDPVVREPAEQARA